MTTMCSIAYLLKRYCALPILIKIALYNGLDVKVIDSNAVMRDLQQNGIVTEMMLVNDNYNFSGIKECSEVEVIDTEEKVAVETYVTKVATASGKFKSYMSYKAITDKTSKQYQLQGKCLTGSNGIRMYEDRFCIAVGSFYSRTVGQKIDVVMENGSILKCIVGDLKNDVHTDKSNSYHAIDGSVVEFIIDIKAYKNANGINVYKTGDVSHIGDEYKGRIKELRIYND